MSKLELCNLLCVGVFTDSKKVALRKSVWFNLNSLLGSSIANSKHRNKYLRHKTGVKLKILQISAYYKPRIGGSERYCHELSKRLVERGHEVHVFTSKLERQTLKNETIDGIQVHRCPCIGNLWGVNPGTFILHKLLKEKCRRYSRSFIYLSYI